MAKREYTSKDITVLDELTHIRTNPAMYIGDTSTPTHLIEEALDNALDECLAGYANLVGIKLDLKNNIYCIMDNGRGIPLDNDIAVTISTKLFSGGKFKGRTSTSYDIVAGIHGIGLTAVNALSDFYNIDIYRDGKHAIYKFVDSKLKIKHIEDYKDDPKKNPGYSTKIQFKPSSKIFESLIPNIDRIRKRLLVASIELPKDSVFVLETEPGKNGEVISLTKDEFFKVCCLNGDKDLSSRIDLSSKDGVEEFNVKLQYSFDGSNSPRIISSVNLLPVESGGTHVNAFYDIIKEFFISKGKKLNLKFQPNDCLVGLRAYLSLYLKEPEFSGQTKEKLANKKDKLSKLLNKLRISLSQYFDNNPNELDKLLNYFDEFRRKIDSKKLKGESHGRRASTKFTKLRDCSSNNGELFVCEGDSAGGGLIQCRDPKIHAILPLKGKIPSFANKKDILENKEIGELIQALGTGVGPLFDINKLKYDKIICLTDADPDGSHIASLLTIALANIVPEIIKRGHYYIALTPLYGTTIGKNFIPIWTKEELDYHIQKGNKINRFKGLGQYDPWKLKICTMDVKTRKLIKVNFSENLENIMSLFSDVNNKRKLLESELLTNIFDEF